ncbi:Vesicle-associated membrane protein-associated protein [Trichinella spiralis]|uniref:Major sperm protein n=1 Tax=Trichinella spiralis TaxID=6334 RepID=A0ABR3KML0_TRISP
MAEKMSKEEDSNKALEKISLPFQEIKVWLSCTQRRHIKFAITNPTNVTIGFHLRSTRPSAIIVNPTYGYIEKHDFAMAKVYFPKVDEHDFKVRSDRLTVLLAVKPEDLPISEPKLLWDEKDHRLDIFARRCITVKYSKPFENQKIKTIERVQQKEKKQLTNKLMNKKRNLARMQKPMPLHKRSKQSNQMIMTENVRKMDQPKTTSNDKGEAKQDKQ